MNAIEQGAALTVADNARSVAECRELLDMLGLLPEAEATPQQGVLGDDLGHGRERRYMAGCRCVACRAKHAETIRKARAQRKADPSRADRAGHGKANTYKNHNCRCKACSSAYREWVAAYRAKHRKAA